MKKFALGIAFVLLSCFFITTPSFAGTLDSISNFAKSTLETANQIDTIGNTFEDAWDSLTGEGVGPDGSFVLPAPGKFNQIGNNTSARGFILNVLNFTLSFLGLIATAAIIYAGYLYVTALGEDSKIEESKKIIIYAVIGIIIILISFALVNTLLTQAGSGGDDRSAGGAGSTGGFNNTGGAGGFNNTGGAGDFNNTGGAGGFNNTGGAGDFNNTGGAGGFNNTGGTGGFNNTGGAGGFNNTGGKAGDVSVEDLFSFQNGITISGGDVQNFADTSVISLESALAGVTIGMSIEGDSKIDLGDGLMAILSSSTPTANHAYGKEGTYSLRSITKGIDGQTYAFQKTLIVGGTTATLTASKTSTTVGDSITLNAASSRTSIGSISNYKWTCSGGNGCFSEVTGKTIAVTFSEAGTYEVSLEVENTVTVSGKTSKTITILSDKPSADFVIRSTKNTNKPGEYIFDASKSENIYGESNSLYYKWTINGIPKTSANSTLTHEFITEGVKNIELIVTQLVNGQTLKSDSVEQTQEVQTTLSVDFEITP